MNANFESHITTAHAQSLVNSEINRFQRENSKEMLLLLLTYFEKLFSCHH